MQKAYSCILYKIYENRHDPVFPIRCYCDFLWVEMVQDRQGLWTEKVLDYEMFPKLQRLGTHCHNL